jgi:hypothetical protein
MEDYLGENDPARQPGRKYAQSEASKKISEASGAPREGLEDVKGTGGRSSGVPEEQNKCSASSGDGARILRDVKG